jgi:hypothetical protein
MRHVDEQMVFRSDRVPAGCTASLLLTALVTGVSGLAAAATPADPPLAAPPPPYRAPYVPTSDAEVLQQVPADSNPTVREMKNLRRALDSDPGSLAAADHLARAYIDFGRQGAFPGSCVGR